MYLYAQHKCHGSLCYCMASGNFCVPISLLTDPERNWIKAPNLCKKAKKLGVTPTPYNKQGKLFVRWGAALWGGVHYQTTWHEDPSKLDPHH